MRGCLNCRGDGLAVRVLETLAATPSQTVFQLAKTLRTPPQEVLVRLRMLNGECLAYPIPNKATGLLEWHFRRE